MYLKSKVELTYNSGITDTTSSIVFGRVENFARNGDCTNIAAAFHYVDDLEATEPIMKGVFELATAEEVQSLYDMIKADLPGTDNEPYYEASKIYLAFRLQMLQTFLPQNPELTLADIELVD